MVAQIVSIDLRMNTSQQQKKRHLFDRFALFIFTTAPIHVETFQKMHLFNDLR